jgi:hypothetical protein
VGVGEMAGNLLVRAIHDPHLTFHEAFESRIAKAAGQREYVLDTLFLEGSREQIAAADSSLSSHGRCSSLGCDSGSFDDVCLFGDVGLDERIEILERQEPYDDGGLQ